MRKIQLVNGEYYHIYNRGVDKRQIFLNEKDYDKFYSTLREVNNELSYLKRRFHKSDLSFFDRQEHLVQIVAYSLLPNHFHLLLKQLKDKGIEKFVHKLCTSYATYFNKKYDRSGFLFQGPYKAIRVNDNRYLVWLSAYINGNVEIHGINKCFYYRWSSLQYFLGQRDIDIVEGDDIILSQFNNLKDYRKFVERVVKESKEIKDMRREYKVKEDEIWQFKT